MFVGSDSEPLTRVCPGSSAVSVLERMLLLDPESRATAAEALVLPYFTEFRDPEDETEAQLYDHSLDNAELPLSQWKREDQEPENSSKTLKVEADRSVSLCFSGHTFTEILSFKPVVSESKETPL